MFWAQNPYPMHYWVVRAHDPLHKRQTGVIVNPDIEPPKHGRYGVRVAGCHTNMTGGH